MSTINIKRLDQSDIYDAGSRPPHSLYRRVMRANGTFAIDKPPPQPFEKYVDLQGNVRRLPLSTASAIRTTNTPEGHADRARVQDAGWVKYGRCMFYDQDSQRWLADDMKKLGPEHFGCSIDRKDIGPNKACGCVEELITRRQTVQRAKCERQKEQKKTLQQLQYEAEQKRNEMLADALVKRAEAGRRIETDEEDVE